MAKMIQKRRKHTQIANDFLQRPELSLQAKGLLALLFTYPENWDFNEKHLEKQSSNGQTSFRTALRELETHGFVYRERTRIKGRYADVIYYLADEPIFKTQ